MALLSQAVQVSQKARFSRLNGFALSGAKQQVCATSSSIMAIDNQWYDELGDSWWDANGKVGPLHSINPARFDYFKSVAGNLRGKRVLDVGCGGGILAESFSREGAFVTGIDLSRSSVAAANRHSKLTGLAIDYANAVGERLPFLDSSFDIVATADFLEHAANLDFVISECSRMLKPSGLFLYDTINRTIRSRIVAVWLLERVLGAIPKRTHDARMFIKPKELRRLMSRHGIQNCETRGLSVKGSLVDAARRLFRNRQIAFQITNNTAISYLGYGVKIG
jgi:2-polyprenyl-6-hydroxyphenyl methylase/3-demethylubiquinone-9 3-methyltransferase